MHVFWPICLLAFFRCFTLYSGAYIDSWTEPFIWITGVDCSYSVNHDWVQWLLTYSKYFLLILPVIGIEPATSRDFHSEALSNQTSYPLYQVSLLDNSEWIFVTYKPRRCSWCNGYHHRKWTRRHELNPGRDIAFHIALIPLGKVWIQLFSLQLWVNSRAD